MKKLIVKSQLKDRRVFDRQIQSIGLVPSEVIWQHERVYRPSDYRPRMNYPRLVMRTEVRATDQPAEYFLYLKRHIEDSGVDMINFTPVGDYTEATGIVHQLGFRKVAEISRQRQEIEVDARTKIYIDTVEGISGSFVKIEAELADDVPVEALRQEIFATLALLKQDEYLTQTYAELLTSDPAPISL